nr:unnamed protein product [Callosobruchus analis]
MLKFFSKFIQNLSRLTSNMRNLTKKDVPFNWTKEHEQELSILKGIISKEPILQIFDPSKPILIQCDASSEAFGSCLLQDGHPIVFASRSLSKSEKRWAQIEKELGAIVFACGKMHYFIYGFEITIQTDHKPLIPIFNKDLDKASARLQRMLLKLLKYNIKITYLPGKDMLVADALSRSYIGESVADDPEMTHIVHSLSNNIPMSEEKKDIFRKAIDSDPILSKVKEFCLTSWPKNKIFSPDLKHFINIKERIYLSNGLLFLDFKVIVPKSLKLEMLNLIHESHFGIEKSKLRARQIFYWPNMSKDIEDFINNCHICQMNQRSLQKETLMSHELPSRAWQFIHSDFFEYQRKNYLLFVDAYSSWIEVVQTKTKAANELITICKNKFQQFGIPDKMFADNNPYNSYGFKSFANEWNFDLVFSSPYHHQSNGLAERYVGIVKSMLKKAKDPADLPIFLMEYHATPLPKIKYSPSF